MVQIALILVAMVTIPLLGNLSDRIGRKPIPWFGAIGLVVLAFPMILLVRAATPVSIFAGLMIMGFLLKPNGRRMWGSPPSAASHDEAVRLIDRQRRVA